MTKISVYNIDEYVTADDKWIGTDVNTYNKTKNFTPRKLSHYFNNNQVINTGVDLLYKYFTITPPETRPTGTLSFETEIGPTVNFSAISTFLLSNTTLKGNYIVEFFDFLVGTNVLLYKAKNINLFGSYKILFVEEYLPEPNFFIVNVEFIEGNGFIEEDEDYMISLIDLEKSSGSTNLSYTAGVSDGTVNSDTGTGATIPLANTINAGLFSAAEKTKLAGIANGANVGVVPNAPITGATKTKITYDSKGLVTAGVDATTADIADSTNKRYVTDANLVVIDNTSGTNTGDQNLQQVTDIDNTTNKQILIPLLPIEGEGIDFRIALDVSNNDFETSFSEYVGIGIRGGGATGIRSVGYGLSGVGIEAFSGDNIGVKTYGAAYGVYTESDYGPGIYTTSNSSYAVDAFSNFGIGIRSISNNNTAITASSSEGPGITVDSNNSIAAIFNINNDLSSIVAFQKDLVTKAYVTYEGDFVANKFIKIGSSPDEILAGDGSVIVAGSGINISDGIISSTVVGNTDLGYTPSPTNGIVTSSTGTDATLPLADGTNAGLITPAEKTKISNSVPYTGATADVNLGAKNITTNNLFDGFISVAASGTLITLTINSVPTYEITGSGGQTIKLPNATTLPNGSRYYFNNNQSSGAILINNNSNTLVASVPSGGFTQITLLSNSIAAGSWERHEQAPSNVSWSTNTFDYAGSITSATWNGVSIADNRIASASTWNAKQSALVSGTNIKTINGNTILGSGDLPVGTVTSVTGTAPVVSSGGTTPAISMAAATASVDGYLTSANFTTFNNKQDKSLSAYSMIANNTASTANATTQAFKNLTNQTYTGTIVWGSVGTAPTGTTTHTYSISQIGNLVTLTINLAYGTAGAATLTTVGCELPNTAPTPALPTSVSAAGNVISYGTGMMAVDKSIPTVSAAFCALRIKSTSPDVFEVAINRAAAAYRYAYITIQYFTT